MECWPTVWLLQLFNIFLTLVRLYWDYSSAKSNKNHFAASTDQSSWLRLCTGDVYRWEVDICCLLHITHCCVSAWVRIELARLVISRNDCVPGILNCDAMTSQSTLKVNREAETVDYFSRVLYFETLEQAQNVLQLLNAPHWPHSWRFLPPPV